MTDKKLTDNETMTALECCTIYDRLCPESCPLTGVSGCKEILTKHAFYLLDRQKENNEDLTSDLTSLQNDLTSAKAEIERLKGWENLFKAEKRSLIKAEAYKECIEKVKAEINKHSYGVLHKTVINFKLDNLLKEMVGDNNA